MPSPSSSYPIGSEGRANRLGSKTHQNDTGNSGAVSEERLKVLFALDDSVKSSLADFQVDNLRARPTRDQDSKVIDKGDTQVIKIPDFKCKFCGKIFTGKSQPVNTYRATMYHSNSNGKR